MQPMQLLGLILQWGLVVIVVLIAGLLASIIIARLYNLVALGILNNLFQVIGAMLRIAINFFIWVRDDLLGALYERSINGLRQAWFNLHTPRMDEIGNQLGTLEILGGAFYFILFLVLAGSDLYFAAIRLPQLFKIPLPSFNPAYFVPVLVTFWVSVLIAVGAVTFDVFGMTHLLPTYAGMQTKVQRAIRMAALISIGVLILAGVLQGLFSWELTSDVSLPVVDAFLNILLFVLGFIATLGMGAAVVYEGLAFIAILVAFARIIPTIVVFFLHIPINLLEFASRIMVSLYGVLGALGLSLWNAFAKSNFVRKRNLPFGPIVWDDRPAIGEDVKLFGI